ncbi:hypothetical protein SKC41_07030 [Mycobacterium sp. 050128]|uniref:hypothetical protein n=1 Tax=Mycobacterium sp. 050128 TaxID=3096112 RepID=UPI002EDA363A
MPFDARLSGIASKVAALEASIGTRGRHAVTYRESALSPAPGHLTLSRESARPEVAEQPPPVRAIPMIDASARGDIHTPRRGLQGIS